VRYHMASDVPYSCEMESPIHSCTLVYLSFTDAGTIFSDSERRLFDYG